jgi:hypothetical protein
LLTNYASCQQAGAQEAGLGVPAISAQGLHAISHAVVRRRNG